jgi:hypothetical protein
MIIILDTGRILENILGNIGGTPVVRINKITQQEGLQCEIGKA